MKYSEIYLVQMLTLDLILDFCVKLQTNNNSKEVGGSNRGI